MKPIDIQGWFSTNDMESYNHLVEKIPNGTLVEVGSYFGRSIASIIPTCRRNNIWVVAVDLWEDNADELIKNGAKVPTVDDFVRNLESVDSTFEFEVMQESSLDASLKIRKWNKPVSAVFLDARHDYDSVKADIEAWLPLIQKGGWIGGHDYCRGWKGVKQAVKEKFGRDYHTLPSSIWWHNV
jgi:cephalosporin hydroxylase